MASRNQNRRERQIDLATQAMEGTGPGGLSPAMLFGRASNDDLELYTPEMLARTVSHAARVIAAWHRTEADVRIETVEGVAIGGVPVSVLTVTDRNMPFLYDSVMGEVTSTHRDLHLAVHPILVVTPGQPIALFDPEGSSDPGDRVSHIQIHLPPLGEAEAQSLVARVRTVLSHVHETVEDWRAMTLLLDQAMQEMEAHGTGRRKGDKEEALAFLRWLRANNFTFLGMREYTYSGSGETAVVERGEGRGLGILSNPEVRVLRQGKDAVLTTPEILEFLEGPDFLIVTKANVKSLVHRRAYMDYVGIKRFDANGKVIGELRVVGLFTSTAYTRPASEIPLLRLKVQRIIDQFGFDPQSHSGKMLINTLESYPRDDLFQIELPLLANFCEQINELGDRPRIRVLSRVDHFDRFVSVLVYVPREQYDSDVREKIGTYLKTIYDGRVSAYYPAFPEGGLARVHFIIGRSGGRTPRVPQPKLEAAVRDIVTRWTDRFADLARNDSVTLTAGDAYHAAFTPAEAYADLADMRAVETKDPIRIQFYRRSLARAETIELKIFHAEDAVSLSRRVPLLENLGFSVVSEQTYELVLGEPDGAQRLVILHDMELVKRDGSGTDLGLLGPALEEAFLSAWTGKVEDDTFNRLIQSSGLGIFEINVLRTYARYLRQTGITYSQGYIADTLGKYPVTAGALFRLFHTRLDPALDDKTRARKVKAIEAALEEEFAKVPNLDEDRILRRLKNVVDATLRTNFFQSDLEDRGVVLAVKLDPKALDGLPEPRPFREIFVYGADVEGVHLRFGKVARGGLRWSDRAQDYRTEVLGLVKAQQVKNAVIVPVGAKGGFFPKQLPVGGNRDEVFRVGTEAYKTFIRSLLSVTDNIVGADVVPPADTVRHDGDDPYFVVAADKGTATFSDTANGIAQSLDFWLDDAFASGGSAGYDHKKMGITARGAWETVKRHFREMNIDIQTTPFTVAGVGDMSGDVFGNGMLLSRQIRLVAAFDHRDIFIDPAPETESAFRERERLFALPRSSWQDYDTSLLSAGGMIISRSEKSVTLTPEAMAAIGLDKVKATPFEIMNAILKAPVDLLWFGGIGTYIRAATESDAEAGDRANDAIRVTADEVRARVIGEGANLGVTQKGRIAYALSGGRCNSDAIDNSAGVNSSDVEVNIKIALASAMRSGRLTRPKRNTLLAAMTDEVAGLVLRNNYEQSLAISLTAMDGGANRVLLGRLMSRLEAAGLLNRKVETLPDDAALAERYETGRALTRPEIGVLLSYAKLTLFEELLHSDLPDGPFFEQTLFHYFPQKMQKDYAGEICDHRLRREIIATILTNAVINWGGPAFVSELMDATGRSAADVVRAAIIANEGFGLSALRRTVDGLDNQIHGTVQNKLYHRLRHTLRITTGALLFAKLFDGDIAATAKDIRAGIAKLTAPIHESVGSDVIHRETAALREGNVPDDLAAQIGELGFFASVPEILSLAKATDLPLTKTAQTYLAVSGRLRIGRLVQAADRLQPSDAFDAMAVARGVAAVARARHDLAAAQLRLQSNDPASEAAMQRTVEQLTALSESGDLTLSKLTVAAGLLTDLAREHGA
ncbi:glutamate dehydrogenase [Rhizobium sp. RU20A]|uniref:NAD-glutamate dehydrogenase n=1 Tax=Rhizobium sp. RU20A TaxID=1907412 RepID=UPI0009547717|nr:NAD-glutamate dehydrogenase [Rhizobium sp. RU20A]SIQ85302.1 glutamate dehydrogenase [Rhizobium sp. RU20A]